MNLTDKNWPVYCRDGHRWAILRWAKEKDAGWAKCGPLLTCEMIYLNIIRDNLVKREKYLHGGLNSKLGFKNLLLTA